MLLIASKLLNKFLSAKKHINEWISYAVIVSILNDKITHFEDWRLTISERTKKW